MFHHGCLAVLNTLLVIMMIITWPATLLKKRFWYRCFPVNFVEHYFIEHLQANASEKL